MADVNPMIEVEEGMVSLLQPLKGAKKLRWLEAIGGIDYEYILSAALGDVPFAAIKYTGEAPQEQGGGVYKHTAQISVLVGMKSWQSLAAQRMDIYRLLREIKKALVGARLPSAAGQDVYYPLVFAGQQWSAISGGGVEVWEQTWVVAWEEAEEA